MARGVQGKIDLTVPGGAGSSVALVLTVDVGKCEAGMGRSVVGAMCRMLRGHKVSISQEPGRRDDGGGTHLWYKLNKNW